MADLDRSTDVLGDAARGSGVRFAIDDFGTGYSSLNYLHRFPAESSKIDRSFVRGLRQGSDDEAIISAVTHLGHSLNLLVTAEGVEQLDAARPPAGARVATTCRACSSARRSRRRGRRRAAGLARGRPHRQVRARPVARCLCPPAVVALASLRPSSSRPLPEDPHARSRHRRHRPQPDRPGHEGLARRPPPRRPGHADGHRGARQGARSSRGTRSTT